MVSPGARVGAIVAAVSLAAAAVAVAVAASVGGEDAAAPAAAPKPRSGTPPLALDLGVRTDAEARDLRRAVALVNDGKRAAGLALLRRHDSLEAKVGEAIARWPDGTVDRLSQLSALYPRSALVQLHLGLALFWAGLDGAELAWKDAIDVEPDTPYAITASDLLHPEFAPGIPVVVPETPAPELDGDPARQLAQLRALAGADGGTAATRASRKVHYGVALQRLGRRESAERVFAEAAALAPGSAEAQVAAAVGRFDKERPEDAFSRLGPLTRRFPQSATVRFHLGLLLLWSGDVAGATRQLGLARRAEPGSPLAREAGRYLARLAEVRKP